MRGAWRWTAWRSTAGRLTVAALACVLAVTWPAERAGALIDDPPDTTGQTVYDAVGALVGWCVYAQTQLVPAPKTKPDLDLSALLVRKWAFPNKDTAACDDGGEPPVIELNLYTTVPDLRGLTGEEAQAQLAKRALALEVRTTPNQSAGVVAVQKPGPGEEIDIDAYPFATQTVSVSLREAPSGRIELVPDLRGWREDDACAALTDRNLRCEVKATGNGQPPGIVTGQDPLPGFEIVVGRAVTLAVDRTAPERVRVPDLIGRSGDQAGADLAGAGLRLVVVTVEGGTPGVVAGQDPPAGTEVDPGSTVTVRIPAAPERSNLTGYATGGGIAAAVLAALGAALLARRQIRRARRPALVTSAHARLEPRGFQVEELPGRPNLAVGVRVRADPFTTELEERS